MTDDPKRDQAPPNSAEGEGVHDNDGRPIGPKPPPPREFQIVQYGFTIPKPSYHRHLGENGLDDSTQDDFPDVDAEAFPEGDLPPDRVVASKKLRRRKMRLWAFFLLVILIYGVFRTLRFMR